MNHATSKVIAPVRQLQTHIKNDEKVIENIVSQQEALLFLGPQAPTFEL